MPIHGQCPGCGRKFQAPDNLSGKRLKCPNCSAVISVGSVRPVPSGREGEQTPSQPSGTEPAPWYAQTADDEQLGPMSKARLDRLVAEGRLDGFCRVRREDWQQFKWAEAVYPQFALPAESETQPAAVSPEVSSQPVAATAEHRLRACPDCGKMISRRAGQCPSCGCPLDSLEDQAVAAEAAGQPTGETSAAASSPETGGRKRKLAALLVAGTVAAALLICVVVVAMGWMLLGKGSALLSRYGDDVRSLAARPPAPPKEPDSAGSPKTEEPATPEEIRRCMEEAAAAAAHQVDEAYRQVHLARSLLDRTEQRMDLLMDLLPSLAEGDLDNLPEPEPEPAAEADDDSYRSQYQPLYDECLTYLRENTPAGTFDRSKVRELANRWTDGKLGPLERELQEQLGL